MNYCSNLTYLNLRNTHIGIETIKALKDLLTHSRCKLKTLIISKNNIDDILFCELCVGVS